MSDPDSAEAWAEIEAKELRLFIGDPVVGLWCPTCLLPSAWQAPVRRDPTEEPGSWVTGCTEEHR